MLAARRNLTPAPTSPSSPPIGRAIHPTPFASAGRPNTSARPPATAATRGCICPRTLAPSALAPQPRAAAAALGTLCPGQPAPPVPPGTLCPGQPAPPVPPGTLGP